MGKNLYIETFGCQMNVSDSEKIAALLRNEGYAPVTVPDHADLIILNTCSVRAKAEEKVYHHLTQLKGIKRRRPKLLIGVGGCVAQQEGERLLEQVSHLDLVFGTHNLHLLPELVREAEAGARRAEVAFFDSETRRDLYPTDGNASGVTRFVTIMQGCDNFCSYCIVPYVRGREISRRVTDILTEIEVMADQGTKEVTLLGQNVNSYGLKEQGEPHFPELLRQIARIPGIRRIRFMTSHPKDMSPELIDCYAELPELCSHIHLPAQTGSDAVLARMKRGYTSQEYLEKLAALRRIREDLQITGDMIVGFPGETEDDFRQTLELMNEVRYADLFSFIYSPRPETEAADHPNQLSRAIKQERLERLQSLQRTITMERNRSLVGSRQELLVEGNSKREGQLFGRTSGNRIVNFTGDAPLVGSLVMVNIVAAYQTSLLGELVDIC